MFKEINKHLLWQLDRLSSISDEELVEVIDAETKRAKAICNVTQQAVQVGQTVIKAHEIANEYDIKGGILGIEEDKPVV